MLKINIIFPNQNLFFECKLNNTETSKKIFSILPQESKINRWGQEIYFKLPLELKENEVPTLNVEVGDVAWWPEGCCLCIFFGKTPISTTEKPKPYSEVTVVGKIKLDKTDIENLDNIKQNSKVRLERL